MSQTPRAIEEDSVVKEYFDFLDRREKFSDWFCAIMIIACILAIIVGGIFLLF